MTMNQDAIERWAAMAETKWPSLDPLPAPSAEHIELMKLLQQISDDVRKLCAIASLPTDQR